MPSNIPVKLPGFGLSLDFTPSHIQANNVQVGENHQEGFGGELFPNALDCKTSQLRLTPLRELAMMRLMNEITDKPDWNSKVFDETIVAKWKSEATAASGARDEAEDEDADAIDNELSEEMVEYCISELRYKAQQFSENGLVTAYDGDVVKSDSIISEELRLALKSAAAPLEQVGPIHQDWHPGSDDIVLDLVHPSLFPVVYGTTRILKDSIVSLEQSVALCGKGEVLPVPPALPVPTRRGYHHAELHGDPFSRKFQWLPCQVEFTDDDDEVKITSYINNLHPGEHKALYGVIEKIIAKAIVMWNHTLDPLKGGFSETPTRIPFEGPEYGSTDDILPENRPAQEPGEDDETYEERLQELTLIQPTVGEFEEPEEKDLLNLREQYAEHGLQVIVKLANIHLTPEKPEYGGGTWHVEGQLNEHICASALYYYDCANITESRLAFRQQSDSETADFSYAQGQHRWLQEIFGCENEESSVQYVGEVLTKEGRLITFPNVFQHRVAPFKLADPTQPGHRKILALFLVDPHIQIISSAHVPCQRRDWWADELRRTNAPLGKLPLEIMQEVTGKVEDFPISLEDAKKLRLELMEERKSHDVLLDGKFRETTFSLCEH
ncbi:hypothetical protein HWV62_4361 [Athelia sp. TMB]|nr:hypothetical protein HWV62_4361 [Athelia sp. TMB]